MILHIALKDLKIIFRDKKALAMMLLMPILIIMILGAAFGTTFSKEVSVKKFPVAVVNNDDGFMSKIFVDEVLKRGAVDMFSTDTIKESEADKLLKNKKVSTVINIPKGFSRDIEANKPVKIEVKSLADDRIKSVIVKSVAGSFAQNISISYASAFAIIDESMKNRIPLPHSIPGISQASILAGDIAKKSEKDAISFAVSDQEKNKTVSSIQYYSAGMLLMFILFGAMQGTKLLIEERETKTLSRMISTHSGKVTIILGKFLGLFAICLLQAIVLVSFTALVYGVDWGPVSGVALLTICSVFPGAAIGMFVGAISKTSKTADGIFPIIAQVFTILGGGMVPVFIMPKIMQLAANVTTNWWGMKGYLDLMTGTSAIMTYCVILVLMGIIYLTVGITKFRVD